MLTEAIGKASHGNNQAHGDVVSACLCHSYSLKWIQEAVTEGLESSCAYLKICRVEVAL